ARCSPRARRRKCRRTGRCSKPIWGTDDASRQDHRIRARRCRLHAEPDDLERAHLDARQAEITLLIGPNGAGKSTVLKTLFGMLAPRSGEVRFEGKRVNGRSQRSLLAEGIT